MIEFKDRVSNKPNRRKITREDTNETFYAKVEMADEPIEEGTPLNKNTFENLIDSYAKVGDIYITSDSSITSEDLSSRFGGKYWQLIDKSFKTSNGYLGEYASSHDLIDTFGDTVITNQVIIRNFSSIHISIELYDLEKLADSNIVLGRLKLENIGIKKMPYEIYGGLSFSDETNAGIMWEIDADGELVHRAVFNGTSVPAGSSFTFNFDLVMAYDDMIDSFCDKFYWKRID